MFGYKTIPHLSPFILKLYLIFIKILNCLPVKFIIYKKNENTKISLDASYFFFALRIIWSFYHALKMKKTKKPLKASKIKFSFKNN